MSNGTVKQVIGPTVDIEFPEGHLPSILNAVTIDDPEKNIHLTNWRNFLVFKSSPRIFSSGLYVDVVISLAD